jgi:uncharacterized membrane protein SpoIIM required for sporulation
VKEITFLKQNVERWEGYEALTQKQDTKPAEVTEMFVELTDDLSFARSNFPESKTTAYVNRLASQIHHRVYKNKKESSNRIFLFWAQELPSMFGKYHRLLEVSFFIGVIGAVLGFVSELYDENFVRTIVGDDYVNTTIERIKKGNPLGVYGEMPSYFMYFYITLNNIRVSFMMFAFGMFFSFGTGFYLLYNCIMLGAFLGMFYKYNLFGKALKVVWIHGTIEMSAIIIAGCAGFVLGNSFMFPGTYSRLESFKRGAKDGIKIVAGLIPFFMCAGFLESFITRYTEMSLWLSLIIIVGSLAFLVWYFILLPLKLKNSNYAATKN